MEKASAGTPLRSTSTFTRSARCVAGRLVVEGGVALRAALELVEEVADHLGQRDLVDQLHALGRQVLELAHLAPPVLAQLHERARVVLRREDRAREHRLLDELDARPSSGSADGLCDLDHLAVGLVHEVRHRRRRGDEVEVELALEALPDDLHVEQAEEAAAEPEAERAGRLRLVGVAGRR